jgi:hypothetical protein
VLFVRHASSSARLPTARHRLAAGRCGRARRSKRAVPPQTRAREAAGRHRLLFTLSRCNKYAANYHIGSLLELHPPKCVTIKKRLRGDGERNDRCGLCRNRRFDRYDWLVDLGRRSRKAVQVIAPFYRPQSSSASRFTAGAFGSLIFIQCGERPDRYSEPMGLAPAACT